ncbi:MAG: SusC/RagA family TonB-linked outer membrane protein [Tannerella sp.]|jgi:TonB-linked SusC/RagA family outer membrane protein|nr:SusC/RagA family TonB-linked outer membrane protein [Tannerella sp.]
MKRIFLTCLLAISALVLSAQERTVTGHVTSAEDNEPIIGATVIVKGNSSIGTVTDIDGNFTLSVPASATTLTVSYVGMADQDVAVAARVNVRLSSSNIQLEEVVVTAMGISREKKALGYAVQDVKSEQLTAGSNTSLTGALQGKLAGVQISPTSGMPGASSKMVIRGARSFTGDNTPLYVVDGMPIASTSDRSTGDSVSGSDYANRSFDIDPNDIESINVLKGQAASALYGMRASNGVVIITTKNGRKARKDKPTITYSSSLTNDRVARLPQLQKTYAQGSGGKYVSPSGAYGLSWGPKISELPNDPTNGGNANGHPGQYYVPQLAQALGLTRDDPETWVTPQAYDNAADFFQSGYIWNNSLNVMKGTDGGFYSFSLGSANQQGIIPSTGMERYNAKLAAETTLNSHFSTGFSGNFVYSRIDKQEAANNGFMSTIFLAPPSYDLKGIPNYAYNDPYTQVSPSSVSRWGNPYWMVENNKYYEKNQRFFGNTYLDYKTNLADGHTLDVKYTLGTDAYQTNYWTINAYGLNAGAGSATFLGITNITLNSLLTASYRWDISKDLVFDALLGNEFIHGATKSYTQEGINFNFPGWNHMSNASSYTSSESYTQRRTVGFFGNISLAYKSLLYLNATGRNDVVSTMPRGNRSFFYPSVSAGFVFTELAPFKENRVLTFGKLRASYAEVGMAGTFYPDYYSKGGYGGGFIQGMSILYPIGGQMGYQKSTTVYDPNLKPQNTRSYEAGIDLSFLNGLFSLSYTYSRQNVKDQIFAVPLARSTGASSYYTNGGHLHTDAHEVTLDVNPVNKRDVKWSFGLNFSKIDNYVDELAEGVENIFLGGYTSPNVRAMMGEKYPVVWGSRFRRVNETAVGDGGYIEYSGDILIDENGMPISGSEGIIARTSPDFTLGASTTLTLFKFRLYATLDWRSGGQIMAGTNGELNAYGASQQTADDRDRGYAESTGVVVGQEDKGVQTIRIPAELIETYWGRYAAIWESRVYDNDFVKLREISLAYPIVSKPHLEINANIFARNLLLWAKVPNIDPETTQGNNNMAGSFERFSLPQSSSYGLGFNVKF